MGYAHSFEKKNYFSMTSLGGVLVPSTILTEISAKMVLGAKTPPRDVIEK